jgi:hypothetical protein
MEPGAGHCYIPPGCSNANTDVERFHATVEREFFDLENFSCREGFFHKAQVYQSFYNEAQLFQRWKTSLTDFFRRLV